MNNADVVNFQSFIFNTESTMENISKGRSIKYKSEYSYTCWSTEMWQTALRRQTVKTQTEVINVFDCFKKY